jgi:hypothetical protein
MNGNRRLVRTYVLLAAGLILVLNLILLFNIPEFFRGLW